MSIFGSPRKVETKPSQVTLEYMRGRIADLEKECDNLSRTLSELRPLRCSFCGKSQHDVKKLIAGPSVFICDECIALCTRVIEEEESHSAPQASEAPQPESGLQDVQAVEGERSPD